MKEAWNTAQQTEDKREKIQASSLAKECYSMKLDLLTDSLSSLASSSNSSASSCFICLKSSALELLPLDYNRQTVF
jgi:hypothetical protein